METQDLEQESRPAHSRLSFGEQLFLRTCCYDPPRPRRVRRPEDIVDTRHFAQVYESAFGPDVWRLLAGKQVLDFGCGEGGYVLAAAERGAGHVTGLDIIPDFRFAEAEAQRRGCAVSFICAASESLPDASFDVVISHDSFEHFEQPADILAEMSRLTRPGGRLLIKFGPPWRNPWGRHMSGTIRRDRPWVHLIVPERTIMRVHSAYHNEAVLSERYAELAGGLNKMTVGRFRALLRARPELRVEQFCVMPLYGVKILTALPVVREFFASGARAICVRE